MKNEVSIILPVHNGARYLEKAVGAISARLKNFRIPYEILIAEDGSTDNSLSLARKLEESNSQVKVLTSAKRLGRGKAIENAACAARAEKIIYMDVDMATDITCLNEFISMLDENDLVIGSRYAPGSKSRRRPLRKFLSLSYILLVNFMCNCSVSDYQCGFKGFRKKELLKICSKAKDGKWFWDTEVVLQAIASGKKVAEVPVQWAEANDSTVNIMSDTIAMFASLLNYKLKRMVA